jgi:hypothetical protein
MLECKTEARWWIILGEQNIRLPMVSLIRWENTNQYIFKNKSLKKEVTP